MRRRKAVKRTRRQAQALNRAMHVQAQVRRRVQRVASRMLRTGQPLTSAARAEHSDPRTVREYLGITELRRLIKKAKDRAAKLERRRRRMLIPTTLGSTPIIVRGSKQASLLGRYMSAIGQYLRTGDKKGLSNFRGRSIGRYPLITDPDTLTSLAQAGALQLDEIYAHPGSSS
jgi:hypothetical protein